MLFKRVRNIAKNLDAARADLGGKLTEPAELALAAEVDRLAPVVEAAVKSGSGISAGVRGSGEGRPGGREILRRCDGDGRRSEVARRAASTVEAARGADPSARGCF